MSCHHRLRKGFLLLLLLPLLLPFFVGDRAGASERIIGSSPAGSGYPWVAALVDKRENSYWGQFCAGSLIHPRWVLTAAHCLDHWNADEMDVVLGRSNLKKRGGERIAVAEAIRSGQTLYGPSDLALLYLARPSTIQPVELAPEGPWLAGEGEVLGWGAKRGYFPANLQKGKVEFLNYSLCDAAYTWEYNIELTYCAGKKDGSTDSCWRDGGGPLLFEGQLLSVISWRWECGQADLPGLYSRILPFQEWIDFNIANPPTGYDPVRPGKDHNKKPKPYLDLFLISVYGDEPNSMDNQHVVAIGGNYPILSSKALISGRKPKQSVFCFKDRPRCINGLTWFKQTLGMGRRQAITEFSLSNSECANLKIIVHIKNRKKPRFRWQDSTCSKNITEEPIRRIRLR